MLTPLVSLKMKGSDASTKLSGYQASTTDSGAITYGIDLGSWFLYIVPLDGSIG